MSLVKNNSGNSSGLFLVKKSNMISVAILILFSSFYAFYNTSKKVRFQSLFGVEHWIHKNEKPSKIIAFTLLILALVLFIGYFGFGSGTLLFFIALMTIGSLIILLQPLNLINLKTLIISAIFLLSLEFLIL